MAYRYEITFDYRCPFARNANLAVVEAVRRGRGHEVGFRPFSLDQAHVAEGEPPIWERPPGERGRGTRALLYALAVRDHFPEHFLDWHAGAFLARHTEARDLSDDAVLRDVAASAGLDPDAVAVAADDPATVAQLASEHVEAVKRWDVFGVPTFIVGDEAVFVRLMEPGRVDDLERALDLVPWSRFNEFKRTRIPN